MKLITDLQMSHQGDVPEFTMEQIRDQKLWLIDGRVYDLASFAHPGGEAVLMRWRGADASAAFRRPIDHEENRGEVELALAKTFRGRLKPSSSSSAPPNRPPPPSDLGRTIYLGALFFALLILFLAWRGQ